MLGATAAVGCPTANAQTDGLVTYRRPSMCSFLVMRTDQQLSDKIREEYLKIPTPEQYNDHNLSVRVLTVDRPGKYANDIAGFLERNYVASRLVGKWFDRNDINGVCNMQIVRNRGLYNATELDKEVASKSVRGMNMLADAGEDLIGNTFVLVHEAHYIDNAKRSRNVSAGVQIGLALLGAVGGVDRGLTETTMKTVGSVIETFKGFRVKFHTSLYQLVWNDDIQNEFYNTMYRADGQSASLSDNFVNNRGKFQLRYIGDVTSSGSQNSFLGISEEHPEIMIRKACCRAIDENIADLQKKFEQFRIKSPIASVNGKEVTVPIGMKEGVNAESEYEILETQEVDGRIKYKRVGTIVPIANRIWDNRYMATEEGAVGSQLKGTTFKLKSGKVPYEGLFVRQIK